MGIDSLEELRIGNTNQWIRVRGTDPFNPVLLLIQQGPGLPMINEARRFEHVFGLEQAFTVVYWDQRGIGRSLRSATPRADITMERMVSDTVSLLQFLRDRFGRRIYVAGFSLGGTIGAYAAARRPDLVATLVTVGMDIDGPAAESAAYDFALGTAREHGDRRAIRQLKAIGPPPHLDARHFATRARWATNFGGVARGETYGSLARSLLSSLVHSPDYSAGDIVRTLRGISAAQAALVPELATIDLVRSLPTIDVPVVMVQGRDDKVAPSEPAERFASSLRAPSKQLVWFDHSAHMAHLDESGKFRALLLRVQAGEYANVRD